MNFFVRELKLNCHNEASLFKASRGYLVRLLHCVRNDRVRGAMFGLDARIALAIFGALSVISGAALYSAIQNAKATALLAEFSEIEKAIEQYMLDTGQDIPYYSGGDGTSPSVEFADEMLDSSVGGWNGPYYYGERGVGTHYKITAKILHRIYGTIGVVKLVMPGDAERCSDSSKVGQACHYWIRDCPNLRTIDYTSGGSCQTG